MLASLREGNYDSLLTEPPATKEHVTAALRQSGRLRSLGVWRSVQQALAGKPAPAFPPAPEVALPKLLEPGFPALACACRARKQGFTAATTLVSTAGPSPFASEDRGSGRRARRSPVERGA